MARPPVLPRERSILPPFILPDEQGRMVDLETFRQRRNLVVIFAASIGPELAALLQSLSAKARELADEDAVVAAVVKGSRGTAADLKNALGLAFSVLVDEQGELVGRFSAAGPSVYLTDRFREIFAVRHGGVFGIGEVLEWLAHINRQCPE